MSTPPAGDSALPDREIGWVDRLPGRIRPFAALARWDRPVGAWLLLLPCWIGQGLATERIDLLLALLFLVGAVAMRGAGCTVNDMVDRDLDAQVERTRSRPLAAGALSMAQAAAFVAVQSAVGLLVLLALPRAAQLTALAAIPLVLLYPFAKRVTWWPQAVLGITFSWGVPVAAAATPSVPWTAALCAYVGCVVWTIGYDTLYAHQDKADDAVVGVRSTARLLDSRSGIWVTGFYVATVLAWGAALALAGKGWIAWAGLAVAAVLLARQVIGLRLDDPADCLRRFRANRDVGLVLVAGLVADTF